jgi:hypothetical protein
MKRNGLVGKVLLIAFVFLVAASSASAAGKKYGLFVGINAYTGDINPLKGCVNDATRMRLTMVQNFGFNTLDTTLLTDAAATRAAILANLKKYQNVAGPGDLFVFHYSGHGTLWPDAYSEETDETKMIYLEITEDDGQRRVLYERGTYDSAIVPVDANAYTSGKAWGNLILDDELYAIFSAMTRKGAQVVLISDSCHSGTIDRAKAGAEDVQRREVALVNVRGVREYKDLKLKKPSKRMARITPPPVKGLYLSMTGSKDDEFSLDASFGGTPMGLFTNRLLYTIFKAGTTPLTYQSLMTATSAAVSAQARAWDSNQNPQLNADFGNPSAAIFSLPATH